MQIRLPSIRKWRRKLSSSRPGRWFLSLASLQLLFNVLVKLLDWKGRVEEAITTYNQVAPVLGRGFAVVASPGFGIALVVLGLCYIIFVPPEEHPSSWTVTGVVAWIACVLSAAGLALLVTMTILFVVNAPRHLTTKQKDAFTASLAAGPDVSGRVAIIGFESCLDCPAYAWELAGAMNDIVNNLHKWKHPTVPIFSTNGFDVRLHGVIVRVHDKNHLPPSGKAITSALEAAGVTYQLADFPVGLPPQFKEITQIEVMPR